MKLLLPIVVIMVVGLLFASCGDSGGGGAGGKGGAYQACEAAVETQLRSPSTADFSGALGSTITNSGDTYNVSGTVDSQNGFGAMIRSVFTCELREVNDNWDLIDLSIV